MKGLKYTILPHGYIENDLSWNVAIPHPARKSNPNPTPEWIKAPCYSILIFHPQEGYILYDTGPYLGDEVGRRPAPMEDLFPLCIDRAEFLDHQLAKLNLSAEDINLIILSHMHWDHSGGLGFFQEKSRVQRVITSNNDFSFGLTETTAPFKPSPDCPYFKKNYEFCNLHFELVDQNMSLCEGIDMILLPGHTPAVLGLLLHLQSGTVIFPSDAINNVANYGNDAKTPGIIYDTLGFKSTVKKVMELEKKHHAKIVFPHDINQYNQLQKVPYWYE